MGRRQASLGTPVPRTPTEFNKISHLENAKEIWDILIDIHEGTNSVKESKLDVLQSQLDKFKMKDGEGVAEMYSRLALIKMNCRLRK